MARAPELERALTRMRGVRGARVEVGQSDIEAIRVLVVPELDAEETSQEVLDLAEGMLGVDVEQSRIEVLGMGDPGTDLMRRRKLSSIATERTDERFKVRITLELGGDLLVGESDSPSVRRFERRAVALATVKGLSDLLDAPIELDSVELLQVGAASLAVVTLRTDSEALVGSAVVRLDDHDAVARATLDALNRLVSGVGRERRSS